MPEIEAIFDEQMPEFTTDGLVRHGFGFYNPNHAKEVNFGTSMTWVKISLVAACMAYCGSVPADAEFGKTGRYGETYDGKSIIWANDQSGTAIVPFDVQHIGEYALFSQEEMVGVRFSGPVESIGKSAFARCLRLQEIILPHTVTNIGKEAFFDCRSLTNAVVRSNIARIPDKMFGQCWKLKHVELPVSLIEIGRNAFQGCFLLREILIPGRVQRIGEGAFQGCSRLQRVILPKRLEGVGPLAFGGCSDLHWLALPTGLERIGKGAFDGCSRLEGLVIEGEIPVADADLLDAVSEDFTFYLVGKERKAHHVGVGDLAWMQGRKIVECDNRDAAIKMCEARVLAAVADSSNGLRTALRTAVDGFSSRLPEIGVNVRDLDSFAANMPDSLSGVDALKAVDVIRRFSSLPIVGQDTSGNALCANASFGWHNGMPVRVEVSFKDGRVSNVSLSDGLKHGVLLGLKVRCVEPDEKMLRWLK